MLWLTAALWIVVAVCGGWYAGYIAHDHIRPPIQRTGWFKALALSGFVFGLALVPLAGWGHTKSGVIALVSLGGYVGLAFVVLVITKNSIEFGAEQPTRTGTIANCPTLADWEKATDEIKAKLLSAFLTLNSSWGEIWMPGARGGSPKDELKERQLHLLASLITLGELAVLISKRPKRLPPVSEWKPTGLAVEMMDFLDFVASRSAGPDEESKEAIVTASKLDRSTVDREVRRCYEWTQVAAIGQPLMSEPSVIEAIVSFTVRPLVDGKLAGRWPGDLDAKVQVTRHLIERSWSPIVARLRALRESRDAAV